MRCQFTIHSGEFLVGNHIEKNFKQLNIWVPAKDTGTDLLITNSKNRTAVSLQVKFSRDYLPTNMPSKFHSALKACGWWTLNRSKIQASKVDFWVLVLKGFEQLRTYFVIIKPSELLKRLEDIHGREARTQVYLWVTKKDFCWETRRLKSEQQLEITVGSYADKVRDFSNYLNNWEPLIKLEAVS